VECCIGPRAVGNGEVVLDLQIVKLVEVVEGRKRWLAGEGKALLV